MKKILLSLVFILSLYSFYGQAITDTGALRTTINTDIVPAANITATKLNRILQGNINAIPKLSWGIAGTANTIPGTHFIGTTDAQALVFKTAGTEVGRISGDGNGKVSFGIGNTASGATSFAAGDASTASGTTSVALGTHVTASGSRSVSFGNYNTSSGTYGVTLGNGNIASGTSSISVNQNNIASGTSSFAAGESAVASGNFSSVLNGYGNIASGANAAAIGNGIKSKSFAGLAVGLFNDSTNAASATAYSATNRAFQIGIGTADNARANALTVLYNGAVGIGIASPSKLLQIGTTDPVLSLKQSTSNQDYQLRVGLGTGLSSQKFDLYDATASKSIMAASYSAGGARISLGTATPYSSSILYAFGGNSGANIDAQADSTKADEGNIEIMSSDYTNGKGIAMRHWGNVGVVGGTNILSYIKRNLALLDFTDDTAVIKTSLDRPLHFGINNIEKMMLTNSGLAVGTTSKDASAALEVNSTTQGVLMPRMTATQGSAISSPADGLIIYVTNTNGTFTSVGFWGRENGAWIKL